MWGISLLVRVLRISPRRTVENSYTFYFQHFGVKPRAYVCCYITLTSYPAFKRNIIHLVVCLTTGPRPLPNRVPHIVRSSASSFKCEYPLLSFRSSSSFLRFLPHLPVTSIPPCIFPSITRCRRQFLRKM
jgi:hypothetical protein